jgi:hypothetical protein
MRRIVTTASRKRKHAVQEISQNRKETIERPRNPNLKILKTRASRSGIGTKLTCRDVRYLVAIGWKADLNQTSTKRCM